MLSSSRTLFLCLSFVSSRLCPPTLFLCPSFIFNRTWQGIISCIMKSSRPVIYTVTVYYSLLSLKTLTVNEAILWSFKVRVEGISISEMLLDWNTDSNCCCLESDEKAVWYMQQCAGSWKWFNNYCPLCRLMNGLVMQIWVSQEKSSIKVKALHLITNSIK